MRAWELTENKETKIFTCRWCKKDFESEFGKFCPHCHRFQDSTEEIKLTEIRDATMQHFLNRYPNIPEYVVQDFMYKNYKDNPKGMDDEFGMWLNDLKWTKETLFITLDFFDKGTQKLLKPRLGGKKAFFIPNDEERHKKTSRYD